MTDDVHALPVDQPLYGRAAVDTRDRFRLLAFQRTAHAAGVLVQVDRTLPDHCPARVTRFGKRRRLLLIAPGLAPAERLAALRAALGRRS